jgi:hypothetical protein
MVNNYNLEWELLKKSRITDRTPKTFDQKSVTHVYDLNYCVCGCRENNIS